MRSSKKLIITACILAVITASMQAVPDRVVEKAARLLLLPKAAFQKYRKA